jgi:hypothetical protein
LAPEKGGDPLAGRIEKKCRASVLYDDSSWAYIAFLIKSFIFFLNLLIAGIRMTHSAKRIPEARPRPNKLIWSAQIDSGIRYCPNGAQMKHPKAMINVKPMRLWIW